MKTLVDFTAWLKENNAHFSVEELRSFETYEQIKNYLTEHWGPPDFTGLYREVWVLDFERVIKLVKDEDVEQNKREIKNARCLGRFATQIFEHDPKFRWVIQEKAMVLSEQDFLNKIQEQLGHEFYDYQEVQSFIYYSVLKLTYNTEEEELWMADHLPSNIDPFLFKELFETIYGSNPWFADLINRLKKCRVDSSDFHHENWGIRPSTGELILIDLGS
jgi:hypothetical protein